MTLLDQLNEAIFLTDGGAETSMIFHQGIDLPHFALFDQLKDEAGTERIRSYYDNYMTVARNHDYGFILESPTWRASGDWGKLLGHDADAMKAFNVKAIDLLHSIRDENDDLNMVISGCVGPRGDGYTIGDVMTAAEATDFHGAQVNSLFSAGVEMVCGQTMTYADEAIGVVEAAKAAGVPVAIAFTVETDGRLPSGQSLESAINQVDIQTDIGPLYYMINCAHPEHFDHVLAADSDWGTRIKGLRCNASKCSHAELDNATELDDGNPQEWGAYIADIVNRHPHISVLGGCCGTDHRHVAAAAAAVDAK